MNASQPSLILAPFGTDPFRGCNSSGDSIIYRSGMNPKIGRNFEVFSPCLSLTNELKKENAGAHAVPLSRRELEGKHYSPGRGATCFS